MNLIKPTIVYNPAYYWCNFTATSKVPWNKRPSAITLSRYSFQNSHRSDKVATTYYYISGLHKVSWYIPEAYLRTMLVVLHNKWVTWWNVLDKHIIISSATTNTANYIDCMLLTSCDGGILHKVSLVSLLIYWN